MKERIHKIIKIAAAISLCFSVNTKTFAQMVPTLPTVSWYDNDARMMYFNALRDMSRYAEQLAPIIADTYRKAYAEYVQGNNYTCIDIIRNFFDSFVIYKIHAGMCTSLYELKGLAYCKTNQMEYGILNLKEAMNLGSQTAKEELNRYFWKYLNDAYQCYNSNNYGSCLQNIQNALSTGLQNTEIYVLAGDTYRDKHNFSEAKRYYKTARKLGDTYYSARIKKMKELRKSLK